VAIWHTRMLGLTPYPAAAKMSKAIIPKARPVPHQRGRRKRVKMQSGVVEGDHPEDSASASPTGNSRRLSKEGSLPKARPVPRQWEREDEERGCRR
jgi:hypothetical protein